jgi:hypothetical protein
VLKYLRTSHGYATACALAAIAAFAILAFPMQERLETKHPAPNCQEKAVEADKSSERPAHKSTDITPIECKKSAEDRIADYTLSLAWLTAVLAASTIGLWIVTWCDSRRRSEELRIIERAFIGVEPGGIRPFEGEDERIACDVIIVNAGNLPARSVRWAIDRKFSEDPDESDFPIDETKLSGGIVIAPKGRAPKGTAPVLKDVFREKRDSAKPDRGWLYVWGLITYHDGFNAGRHINFCHRYNLRGERGLAISAEKARYHERGNSTDDG